MFENRESLPMTVAGSEFQTDGAVHRKERFAKSVRANGWMSTGIADERSVHVLTRRLMCCLRSCGKTYSESCMLAQTPCSQF